PAPPAPAPPAPTSGNGAPPERDVPDIQYLDPDNWMRGSSKADKITGTSRDDYLNGRSKADTLRGLDGDDTYNVNVKNDRVIEAANGGTDRVVSYSREYDLAANVEHGRLNRKNAELNGNNLDNGLLGSTGNDRMDGRDGDDFLIGNRGRDTLTGGEGDDVFVYRALNEGGDFITDFTSGEDVIDLRDLNISEANIEIKQSGGDAAVYVNNQLIALLDNVSADQVSATNDFWL
ncbi:MAG: hypothetical protein AAGC83_00810, partial [Pseudomonadota bacterium]